MLVAHALPEKHAGRRSWHNAALRWPPRVLAMALGRAGDASDDPLSAKRRRVIHGAPARAGGHRASLQPVASMMAFS